MRLPCSLTGRHACIVLRHTVDNGRGIAFRSGDEVADTRRIVLQIGIDLHRMRESCRLRSAQSGKHSSALSLVILEPQSMHPLRIVRRTALRTACAHGA